MDNNKIEPKIIEDLFDRGFLVNKELLNSGVNSELLHKIESEADLIVLNSDYIDVIEQESNLVDWYEFDKYRVDAEKERNDDLYQAQLQTFRSSTLSTPSTTLTKQGEVQKISSLETSLEETSFTTSSEVEAKPTSFIPDQLPGSVDSAVTIVQVFENKPHKYTVNDFGHFFQSRYKFLEAILRPRLENTLAISRALGKKDREHVSVIGLVEEINETRNGNIILTLEDPTGRIKVFIPKKEKELFAEGQDLVVDEVIGISGTAGEGIIFSNSISWPDIPNNHLKKGPKEEYVIFLSDVHVGSKLFLQEEFNRFLKWIRGEAGSDTQRNIASKVKYLIVAGDLVDGVGIYPAQFDELSFPDIKEQYVEFARLIKMVPKHIQIIMCPGNHDAVHLAEPQPSFQREFSEAIFDIPNVSLVTNPSIVNVGKSDGFEGLNILLYHGYSFDYYVANVNSIRTSGGYKRSDLIMKFLLKRRHLAPAFTSTPYHPSHKEDPLLIKKIPDIFITGHIHYCSVGNYKGVTMISGSCWQGKTDFQEKLGHHPEPARVPIVNIKTREVKVLKFI